VAHVKNGAMFWDDPFIQLTKSCPKLVHLSLDCPQLSEQGLACALKHCGCLQQLTLGNQYQVIPVDIAIPTLKSIQSNSHCMNDAALIAFGQQCAKLETLVIFASVQSAGEYTVTDVGVRAVLQGCPLLRETDVEYAEGISTELRVELARRRDNITLDFGDWWKTDNELAQEVLKASPNLTTLLCTEGCEWLTDATLAACAQHCPLVQDLELYKSPNVTDNGVRTLVTSLAITLRCAKLLYCSQLSDDALRAIAEHCPLLEVIVCTINVSDATVVKLAEGCAELRYVYLNRTQVGDAGLIALATHCPKVRELYLYSCPHVTVHGVRALAKHCKRLAFLALDGHLSMERETISQLMSKTRIVYV
jgi:hypothetical protein